MSAYTSNDIKKGRVAEVTKQNATLGIPKGCFVAELDSPVLYN